jgi:formylmethanofuran dehydrogenase subunit E
MSAFETYDCENCGEEFKAHPSANAAADRLCSPKCATEDASG